MLCHFELLFFLHLKYNTSEKIIEKNLYCIAVQKLRKDKSKPRARPGFEPGTTRTLSEYPTPRPTSQLTNSGRVKHFIPQAWAWHLKQQSSNYKNSCPSLVPAGIEPATLSV